MTALAMISRTIYSLKRAYGLRAVIHRRTSETVDLETGVKVVVKESWVVNRAAVLPSTIHKEFFYDLTFIASNKQFTYGGHVDTSIRRIIIDRKDMPLGWEPQLEDHIVFDGRRYEVKEIAEFEFRAAFILTGKHMVGQPTNAVETPHLRSTLHLSQTVVVTKA